MKKFNTISLMLFLSIYLVTQGISQVHNSPHSQSSSTITKRPVSLEDYYRIESVNSPAISPDGKKVAYVRTYIIEKENRRQTEIWLAAVDSGDEPVRLTNPAFNATNPQWSPDATLLAFSSRREVPQADEKTSSSIWFLRMDRPAGEAFQITGVGGRPIFSPDNKWIAFTKRTPPESKPEKPKLNEFERKIQERFKGRIFDWMNYRFDRRGYLPDPRDPQATPAQELYVVPRAGGDPKQITELGFNVQRAAWRRDGTALAFTADSHQRDEHSYERADVWLVSTNGKVQRLTDDGFNYSSPAFSPDSKSIVVRGNLGLDKVIAAKQDHGAPTDLFLIPTDGGPPENLTADWDLIPGQPQWSGDGKSIYFTAATHGNFHLFKLTPKNGHVEQVTTGDRWLRNVSFSANFKQIVYSATTPTQPGNIFGARNDGSEETRLTESNKNLLNEIQLSSTERIQYQSKDGTAIEGWVMKPVNYDAEVKYPMILVIHGGPHSAYGNSFSFQRQLLTAQDYFVLFTNPRASTGYGEKFRWATWGSWGFLDFEDVMAGVDYALQHYAIDENRLGVTGYSYGGYLTNWAITHTKRFTAAISGASISNWVSDYGTADIPRTKESEFFGPPWQKKSRELLLKSSPIVYAGNVVTPTMFIHGEADLRVPIEEAEQMYVALKKQRVPAKFIRYPETYHGGWTLWRTVHRYFYELQWWQEHFQLDTSSSK